MVVINVLLQENFQMSTNHIQTLDKEIVAKRDFNGIYINQRFGRKKKNTKIKSDKMKVVQEIRS